MYSKRKKKIIDKGRKRTELLHNMIENKSYTQLKDMEYKMLSYRRETALQGAL